jgi:segregation and condensation protein A
MPTPISLRPQPLGANYAVTLPAFEGPLDLLLHLIETQELDISAISLMTVTDQYLKTLGQLEEIEPGALADFLVVASRLLYIKSYHLLPKPRPEGEEEDEEASGDALVRQLLEYRRFKEVAGLLRTREERGLRAYIRTAPRPDLPRKLDLSSVDVNRLQQALRRVLARLPVDPPLPRVKTYAITVADQIANVRDYINQRRGPDGTSAAGTPVSFVELLSRGATRLEVIVTFLAVLELVKQNELEVIQDDTFGEIQLLPLAPAAAATQPPEHPPEESGAAETDGADHD